MIYLDNAATTFPKPEEVYRAMDGFYRTLGGNPGRAGHRLATGAEAMIGEARLAVARLIGASDPSRVVFTLNASDALNMAIKGVLRAGDHVVTSNMEHNSVVRPLNAMARAGKVTVDRAANSAGGVIEPDSVRALLRPDTRLVAVTWASNAFGTLQPVAEIAGIVKAHGALLLLDASQAAGAVPVDVSEVACDLLAFPGHKALMGPTGTGVLWVREGVECNPFREGGTGGDSTRPVQPEEMPFRLEGGTPNTLGMAGLLAGVKWVSARTIEAIREHEVGLVRRLLDGLSGVGGVTVKGPPGAGSRVAAVSFLLDGWSPQEVCAVLDQRYDIAVRPGLHCAPDAHRSLGTFPDGTVRASLGPLSSEGDVDVLVGALREMSSR